MATIKIVLHKSKVLANGKYPIYIRLTNKGDTYFPIYKRDKRFQAFPDQWDEENNKFIANKTININHKQLNEIIDKRELKFKNIIEGFINSSDPWTVNMVREEFYNEFDKTSVFDFIDYKVSKLHELKKDEEAKNYEVVKKELGSLNKSKLSFPDIDYEFVTALINNMQHSNLSDTTIGIRLRYLRKILNEAIKEKVGSKTTYPFSDKFGARKTIKISIFEKTERKIAIDLTAIDKIKNASFEDIKTETARRVFLASYARGINFRDMSYLSEKNLSRPGGVTYLTFKRNKTKKSLSFPITPLLQEQLDWFKENFNLSNGKLFPIKPTDFKKQLDSYNYYLKKIAEKLSIPSEEMKLTSYTPRHSFASMLYNNGVHVNFISEELAHTHTSTTEAYLKQFEDNPMNAKIAEIIG